MKVLALVDSISLPRQWNGVSLEDTYLSGLNAEKIWIFGGGGKTITEIADSLNNFTSYFPKKSFDLGIIALGLVDCAPQPKLNRFLLAGLPPILHSFVSRILYPYRPQIQRWFGYYQRTPLSQFSETYTTVWKEMTRICEKAVAVPIMPILDAVENRSPGLNVQINAYNQIIKDIARTFPLYVPRTPAYLTKDAHITPKTHSIIASEVRS